MLLKQRIAELLKQLRVGLFERDEIFSVVLLSALAEQNIFLYGPPGTAKSLISRRLSKAFESKHYFEHLLQRFSTPEEIFGPISISELKKDNYERKVKGFLPEADFAFLDEIWKSTPAILNTLLTILNEKIFKNGSKTIKVPLKVLISASNETPPENQGLEALFDRFLTRLYVAPIEKRKNFETILQAGESTSKIKIDDELKIKENEWNVWKKEIRKVVLSKETFDIINGIRFEIEKLNKKSFFLYVSDRRWQKAALLLKASAFFSNRKETDLTDCLFLPHCLWTTKENRKKVFEIVENVIKINGVKIELSFEEIDKKLKELENEINKEFFYSEDVYKTVKIAGKDYFKYVYEENRETSLGKRRTIILSSMTHQKPIVCYIPVEKISSTMEFSPVDINANKIEWIKCKFDKNKVCSIKINNMNEYSSFMMNSIWKKIDPFTPEKLFYKGEKKQDINPRLVKAFKKDVEDLKSKLTNFLKKTEVYKREFLKKADNPFLSKEKIMLIEKNINSQIKELKKRIRDCNNLINLMV